MISIFKSKEHDMLIAIFLAIIIHMIILIGSYFTIFKKSKIGKKNYIKINFRTINKEQKKLSLPLKKDIKVNRNKKEKNNNEFSKAIGVKKITSINSIDVKLHKTDSLSKIDSFLVKNSNITVLKIASKEKLKNCKQTKSKNELAKEKITNMMSDYFKAKYPTPPYKFGEKGTGNLINIPIDGIKSLFKEDEKEELEKLKKLP